MNAGILLSRDYLRKVIPLFILCGGYLENVTRAEFDADPASLAAIRDDVDLPLRNF